MKVDHVYSRWLAVQQPTMVSNKQKALFFGRCPLLTCGLCCESAIYTAIAAALHVRTSPYDFSLYYFRNFFLRRQPDSSLIRPLVVQGQRSRRHYTYCLNRSCSAPCLYRYMYNNIKYNTARSGGGACAHV